MTNGNDLMQPRYEVVADMPLLPFKEGEIYDADFYPVALRGEQYYVRLDLYPHLFRKLQWWEKRQVSEMPEYVKTRHGIYKVHKWKWEADEMVCYFKEDVEGYRDWTPDRLFAHPATEQEYISQLNKTPEHG